MYQSAPKSFQKRFIISTVILTVTTLVFILMFFWILDRQYRSKLTHEVETMAQILTQNVENFFSAPESYLNSIKYRISESAASAETTEIVQYIGTTLDLNDAFEGIYLLDFDGIVLNTWPPNREYLGVDFSNQDYFRGAIRQKEVYWSDSFISSQTLHPIIGLSVRSTQGIVVIFYNLSELSQFVSVDLAGPEEFIAILDKRGDVVAHTDPRLVDRSENLNLMQSVRSAHSGTFGISVDHYKGIPGLVSVFPARNSSFLILVFRSYRRVFDQIMSIYTLFFTCFVVILVVLFGAVLFFIRASFRPLSILSQRMQTVADGSYDLSIESEYAEFDALIRNFRKMVDQVRDRESALKDSLGEKETLLRELYHRTKNNMQVILSLIRLYDLQNSDKNTSAVLRKIGSKILSISLVHEKLYRSESLSRIDLNDYVEELIPILIQSYSIGSDRVAYRLDIDKIFFLIDFAVPCGLILNELITNTLKYAFPKGRHGTISIACRYNDENGVILRYEDNGVGVPEGFNLHSAGTLGFTIIKSIVESQLNGRVEYPEGEGFACHIFFRMDEYTNRI